MKHKFKLKLIASFVAAFGLIGGASAFFGRDIVTDLLKIGGIGFLVDRLGPEMNRAMNQLQGFNPSEENMTKVVPILSVGSGTHIGAAQVMGPRHLVNRVTAVAQLETSFAGAVRLKALIPVESKDVVRDVRRVVGVGVSGIVDIKV